MRPEKWSFIATIVDASDNDLPTPLKVARWSRSKFDQVTMGSGGPISMTNEEHKRAERGNASGSLLTRE